MTNGVNGTDAAGLPIHALNDLYQSIPIDG